MQSDVSASSDLVAPRTTTETSVVPTLRLRWWREVGIVASFYGIYTAVRNLFGSASVSPDHALEHAQQVIRLERAVGLFHEQTVQGWFLGWSWFMWFWNVFYGTFHFVVTIAALLYLFHRVPDRYRQWRNTLAATTALALIGFSLYPLMPPRLLSVCGEYGGCTNTSFVDTLQRFGGLWSFDSGTMQSISNQYAAMPSLHFAWSTWCWLALRPVVQRRSVRVALAVYPWLTLFAIVVTANHFWIDAAGGALALAVGYAFGSVITRAAARWRLSGALSIR
ncbi:MAG: phosphatase PAP2 family protein [Acidimicrobiales bacterium]